MAGVMRRLIILLFLAILRGLNSDEVRLPVVYAFTVSTVACKWGLPEYISFALKQALISQPDADVILASNYLSCPKMLEDLKVQLPGVIAYDTDGIRSNRTAQFHNVSGNIFQSEGWGELWVTSALRFFILEDLMISRKWPEMIHVEADNLLYGSLTTLLPILRKFYKGLAATPLNTSKTFITASVFWVSSLAVLVKFNDFMLAMALNTNRMWDNYLDWLKPHACCKYGGVRQDAKGMGLKPYAVNEMSMLAFYRHIAREEMHNLPIAPIWNKYYQGRHVVNVSEYAPGGREVGAATLTGVWDPNSWGQFLGGTHSKGGRDRGFSDNNHVAGQSMRTSQCRPAIICGNATMHSILPGARFISLNETYQAPPFNQTRLMKCYTAPFVHCPYDFTAGEYGPWTPLWNLHVHSKRTQQFVSLPCACGDDQGDGVQGFKVVRYL